MPWPLSPPWHNPQCTQEGRRASLLTCPTAQRPDLARHQSQPRAALNAPPQMGLLRPAKSKQGQHLRCTGLEPWLEAMSTLRGHLQDRAGAAQQGPSSLREWHKRGCEPLSGLCPEVNCSLGSRGAKADLEEAKPPRASRSAMGGQHLQGLLAVGSAAHVLACVSPTGTD